MKYAVFGRKKGKRIGLQQKNQKEKAGNLLVVRLCYFCVGI
jgi:hypothetical protein